VYAHTLSSTEEIFTSWSTTKQRLSMFASGFIRKQKFLKKGFSDVLSYSTTAKAKKQCHPQSHPFIKCKFRDGMGLKIGF